MPTSRFTIWTFVLCLLLSLLLVVHLLWDFITPIIMAMVIVSIFKPVYVKILRHVKNRVYVAAALATFLVLLLVLLPMAGFMVVLAQQSVALFDATQELTSSSNISVWMVSLKSYLDLLNNYLGQFSLSISTEKILKIATSVSQDVGQWLYSGIGMFAANVLSVTIDFLLTITLVFVFFVSGPEAKQFVMDLIPFPHDEKERVAKRFRELSSAVFIGNGLISILEGILGGLSFFAFQISGALIWGVLITVTAFLPIVGSAIIVIPAAIYLFLIGHTWQAIVFLVFNCLQLIILETLVKPRLIGKKSQMHAALVFMSVLAGIQIYGVFGLFYGPLLVTVFLTLAQIYKEHYRERLLKN